MSLWLFGVAELCAERIVVFSTVGGKDGDAIVAFEETKQLCRADYLQIKTLFFKITCFNKTHVLGRFIFYEKQKIGAEKANNMPQL